MRISTQIEYHFSDYPNLSGTTKPPAARHYLLLQSNKQIHMNRKIPAQSRYLSKFPVCFETFHGSEIKGPIFAAYFPCPKCGEELEFPIRHYPIIAVLSGLVAVGFPFLLGFRGATYVLSSLVVLPVAWLVIIGIVGIIDPPHEARIHRKFVPNSRLSKTLFKLTEKRKP